MNNTPNKTKATTSTAETFRIDGELTVNRLGFGAMRLTGQPGNFGPYADWEAGKALLRRAVELGVNFIDTAQAYGPGWSEQIIADALYPYPEGLVIATKGGIDKLSPTDIRANGTPAFLRSGVEDSLQRLRLERLDLYQLHRLDPNVPLEESVGALEAMRQEGLIRLIGLSNVSTEQLERARRVAPIASVQNRYSVTRREHDTLLSLTAQEGIAFIPYGPLDAPPFERDAPLAHASGVLAEVAERLGATSGQVALSWLLHRAPNILPIPGTTSTEHLEENVAALRLQLGEHDLLVLGRNGS